MANFTYPQYQNYGGLFTNVAPLRQRGGTPVVTPAMLSGGRMLQGSWLPAVMRSMQQGSLDLSNPYLQSSIWHSSAPGLMQLLSEWQKAMQKGAGGTAPMIF